MNQSEIQIIGDSEAIEAVKKRIEKVARTNATVLITGETGVGKELVAKKIHELSSRKDKQFKAVNCGVLSGDLLESEIFGHEEGAFTGATSQRRGAFELADGGTLFLDEIGEMPPEAQVKFLRVLEEQKFTRLGGEEEIKVDVRIITATNANLQTAIEEEEFRKDLYYRINLFRIDVPPLGARREDIPKLVDHFIEKLNEERNPTITGITEDAIAYLEDRKWEGNVRELRSAIEEAMVMTDSDKIERCSLPEIEQMAQETKQSGSTSTEDGEATESSAPKNEEVDERIIDLLKSGGIPEEKLENILNEKNIESFIRTIDALIDQEVTLSKLDKNSDPLYMSKGAVYGFVGRHGEDILGEKCEKLTAGTFIKILRKEYEHMQK